MKNINEMTLDELAEYAVTLDAWEWRKGIVDRDGDVVTGKVDEYVYICEQSCIDNTYRSVANPYAKTRTRPDIEDPATLGCVLAMVRKKYGNHAFVRYSVTFDEWCVGTSTDIFIDRMPTEAHALIAALAKEKA